MKGLKFSATAGFLAAAALVGCSADHSAQPGSSGAKDGSMSFNLVANGGVTIDNINYDVKTQGGTEVVNGAIPVPDAQSQHVPVLGIQSLSAGPYTLLLSATGKLTDGTSVPCTAPLTGFNVTSGNNTFVGDITLTCSTTSQVDTSGSASADVSVTTVNTTLGSVIETFTFGPRSVQGNSVGGACVFAPIAVKVANTNTAIHYSWAATPDGTFALNTANTQGTYQCASPGQKVLTVTGVLGTETSTKSVTVTCAPCGVCGDGILQPGEQCDENTARCTNCKITPVCGDGTIDSPETCEPPNTNTCSATCQTVIPTCGDGKVNQSIEQCDNGAANSDTTPNACRTNCHNPSCGDGVTDTGEQCDPPNGTTCSATCQHLATCGDGHVDPGEQCDPPNGTTCSSTCQTIAVCGDGVVTPPEQCEPPNTTTCDATCRSIISPFDSACHPCIAGSADAGSQAQYCDSSSSCLAVEKCAVDSGCFTVLPALCYCGTTDVDACGADAFVPTGQCHAAISAGEPAAVHNSDVLQGFFDFGTATGVAMDILNDVQANIPTCKTACKL